MTHACKPFSQFAQITYIETPKVKISVTIVDWIDFHSLHSAACDFFSNIIFPYFLWNSNGGPGGPSLKWGPWPPGPPLAPPLNTVLKSKAVASQKSISETEQFTKIMWAAVSLQLMKVITVING